jgi:hypothetical protein
MDHVSSILGIVLKKRGFHDVASSAHILSRTHEWIAEHLKDLAPFLAATKVVSGVLFIEASHAVALQECSARTEEILHFLHQDFEKKILSSVQVIRAK